MWRSNACGSLGLSQRERLERPSILSHPWRRPIVNELISDLENRVSEKAFVCAKFAKKSTLAAPHVQTAAKLVFPSDMGGMAVQEASKALTKFMEPVAA